MTDVEVIEILKDRFRERGNPVQIPLLKGGKSFEAMIVDGGIEVDNIGNQPFLPWSVFSETMSLLRKKGGRAIRGNHRTRLGSSTLQIDSVEGHIAHVVYGKKIGNSVFRRITPIACILIWAKICRHEPRYLVLADA